MSWTLIPMKDEDLQRHGIPVKVHTLYGWRKKRKHMEIFTKVGRRVFIVKEKWDKFVEKGFGKVR